MDMQKGINVVKQFVNNCTYSMFGSRYYTDGTCDCSGSVYRILREAGGSNFGYIPSTETLHAYLLQNGFELIAENTDFNMQAYDVIIWGKRGYSAGANGHTGVALDNQNWIECTGWKMTTIISNHDQRWAMAGSPYFYAYRLKKGNTVSKDEQEKNEIKELKIMSNMNFLFTAEGEGATFFFDGQDTIMFSDSAQLDMVVGNYEAATGKKLVSVKKFNKTQFKIWTSMYPVREVKKTW